MKAMRIDPVPFEEAVVQARRRKAVLPDEYYGTAQGISRAESFSVSGLARLDQVKMIRDSLTQALENGETFSAWKERVRNGEVLTSLPDYRLETIFRTNIQGSYARGRCKQHDDVAERRPYLLYSAVNDSRTRPAHVAMNGTILHRDDPFWQTHRPPNGYNCRCTVIALTPEQVERRGGTKAPDVDEQTRQPPLPDKGWEYDVCGKPRAGTEKAISDAEGGLPYDMSDEIKRVQTKAESFDPATWRALPDTQLGRNAGSLYEAPDGSMNYVKFHDNKERSYNEVAASKIYERMGVETLKPQIIVKDGRTGVSTKWKEGLEKLSPEDLSSRTEEIARIYNASALTKNIDVFGEEFNNVVLGPDGNLVLLDPGGSFKFNSNGTKKVFDKKLEEIESLLDYSVNPQSSVVYKEAFSKDPDSARKQIDLLENISKEDFRRDMISSGVPDVDADELVEVILARKKMIIEHYRK